jgi:hypothetical protein
MLKKTFHAIKNCFKNARKLQEIEELIGDFQPLGYLGKIQKILKD